MAFAALAVGATVFQTVTSLQAQKHAQKSAQAQAQYEEKLLTRRAESERSALRENASRRIQERERTLAEVRAANAASGVAMSGTQLAVFGQIGSRINDQIDEATNQSLDRIQMYGEQVKMSQFQTQQQKVAGKIDRTSTIIGGVVKSASRGYDAYQTFGNKSPFSLFD